MSMEPKRAYKIVLIGDPEVGKTSIRRRYMGKSFRTDYLKTLGADFAAQKVNIDGEVVLLTIWDLAGQTIFHGMRSSFYHGCKCALVVFDVTNKKSLENTLKWADEAANYAKKSLQDIYLIGNKIDLVSERVVSKDEMKAMAKKIEEKTSYKVRIYETSALTGENINELFEKMSKRLILGDVSAEEVRVETVEKEENTPTISPEEKALVTKVTEIEELVQKLQKKLSELKHKLNM